MCDGRLAETSLASLPIHTFTRGRRMAGQRVAVPGSVLTAGRGTLRFPPAYSSPFPLPSSNSTLPCPLSPTPIPPPAPYRSTDGQRRWYHVFVWSLCVGTTAYTLASGAHEKSNDHTCWVRADNANSLVFEGPLYAYMGLSLASLGYAALRLQCNRSSGACG